MLHRRTVAETEVQSALIHRRASSHAPRALGPLRLKLIKKRNVFANPFRTFFRRNLVLSWIFFFIAEIVCRFDLVTKDRAR